MKKGYLVGGLAIVGAVALFMYLKPKPRRNSDGFFSADGRGNASGYSCVTTNPDGSRTITTSLGSCPKGSVLRKNTSSLASL